MAPSDVLVAREVEAGDQASGVNPVALSKPSCRRCAGLGAIRTRRGYRTCVCVLRRVFHACLTSYHHCEASMGSAGAVQYERVGHAQGRCAIVASFKRAEYAADFILLARRVLAHRPVELAVFEAYHVDGLEWRVAVPRVNRILHPPRPLNRGSFFHAVYRAESLIAAAIVASQPYSLFPPRLYPLRNHPQRIARPTAITPFRIRQLRAVRSAPEILTFDPFYFGVPKAFISRLYFANNQTFDSKFAMFIPAQRLTFLVLRITFDL